MSALGRLDWIRAGQELLREGGITHVKLARLTERLQVTTGSFYHHFPNFRAYLDTLADEYGTVVHRRAELPPEDRIRMLLDLREEHDLPALDRAMRIWAASDERARDAVHRLDRTILEYVRQAFLDLGFDADEARARALTAFAAGAGLGVIDSPWPEQRADRERALRLFLSKPDQASTRGTAHH